MQQFVELASLGEGQKEERGKSQAVAGLKTPERSGVVLKKYDE